MEQMKEISEQPVFNVTRVARNILTAFLLTFILARITVFLIMSRSIPDLYLYFGGTHIHHLNYGIFLLAGIGAYMLLARPHGRKLTVAAVIYGIGMGLTFDEFAMWLRLDETYWQRASWDAVIVIAAGFALIAFAPSLKRFRPHHWFTAIILIIVVLMFFFLLVKTWRFAGKTVTPKLQKMESTAPK
jgi:ABC-type branched-subunit amino acid transport system permease subunit